MGISPVHFLAGAVAGTAEHCGMYPIDTIKVRVLQSSYVKFWRLEGKNEYGEVDRIAYDGSKGRSRHGDLERSV